MARNDRTIWIIVLVLIVLWLGGVFGGVGGNIVHILIVIALVLVVWRLATGKRVL